MADAFPGGERNVLHAGVESGEVTQTTMLRESATSPETMILAQNVEKDAESSSNPVEDESAPKTAIPIGKVTVTGERENEAIANIPAVVERVTAEDIEHMNVVDTSDVFKYLPGVFVHKLTQGGSRTLVIRGNSTSLPTRTLVEVDGILISNYLGGGYGPKWYAVAPEEIDVVDVIYGPYSAAKSGNSFGGAAIITTHMPQKREVVTNVSYNYQNFREFKTDLDLHGYNAHISYGDRIGPLSFMLWYDRLEIDEQPITYPSRLASAGTPGTAGTPVYGWVSDTDPQGNKRYILGTQGEQEDIENTAKIKLAYDLTTDSQLLFSLAFWDNSRDRVSPESYLRDADGNPVYTGRVNIDGRVFNLAGNTFTYQETQKQEILSGLTYSLNPTEGLKLTASGSIFSALKDLTRLSSTSAPASADGGAGTVTDRDTGWYTADLKGAYDISWFGKHTLGAGYHFDNYYVDSEVWNASDWKHDERTTLSKREQGKTGIHAVFLEDSWDIVDQWTVYLGGRCEWWKGYDGSKSTDTASGRVTTEMADKSKTVFSPKFATTYRPAEGWSLRFSMGQANRFPTVEELYYGGITSSGFINNANPDLKPEKIFAKDFTITRSIGQDGEVRLSFFQDDVDDAILSQTNFYTNVTNYQNVDEVRTRGIELSASKRNAFVEGLGVHANVTWNDSEILRNDNVPKSVGKTFPRVPEWRAKFLLDYAPTDRWFVSFGGTYSSRPFYYLDNSDKTGGYGGVDDFLVFNAKVSYRFLEHFSAAVGVDNLTDELYHGWHPYPRRTIFTELKCSF